jgi:hypothetical protein
MDPSFSSFDVLCGKGPASFHHGTLFTLQFLFLCITLSNGILNYAFKSLLQQFFNKQLAAGNVRYREAVLKHIESYTSAKSHLDRDVVVQSVINSITSSGGRFLHKVDENAMVGDH